MRVGNGRSAVGCLAEASAAQRKSKADADATAKVDAARRDVAAERRDADYKVALERCNLLGGSAKEACVSDVKVKFGK